MDIMDNPADPNEEETCATDTVKVTEVGDNHKRFVLIKLILSLNRFLQIWENF